MEDRTKTLLRLDDAPIRLACAACDRDDMDGITPEQLEQAKAQGWTDIEEVQSYDDSMQTYDNPDDAPPGSDVTTAGPRGQTAGRPPRHAPQGDRTGELRIADLPVDNPGGRRSRFPLAFGVDQRSIGRIDFASFAMLDLPWQRLCPGAYAPRLGEVADFRIGAPPGAEFGARNSFLKYSSSAIRRKTYVKFARAEI